MNDITLTLTESQVENLTEFFDLDFIRYIRDRIEEGMLDNMACLVDMCEIYCKIKSAEAAVGSAGVDDSFVKSPTEPEKMTNFDRIKAMTPKELAEFLYNTDWSCDCCIRKGKSDCDGECRVEHTLEWLEEETQ